MDYYQNKTQVVYDLKNLINLLLLKNRMPNMAHPAMSDGRLRNLLTGLDKIDV